MVSWARKKARERVANFQQNSDRQLRISTRENYAHWKFKFCPQVFPQNVGFSSKNGRQLSNKKIFQQFCDSPKFKGAIGTPCHDASAHKNSMFQYITITYQRSAVRSDSGRISACQVLKAGAAQLRRWRSSSQTHGCVEPSEQRWSTCKWRCMSSSRQSSPTLPAHSPTSSGLTEAYTQHEHKSVSENVKWVSSV